MAATRPNLGTCPDRPQRVGDGCCVCLTLSLAQGDLRHKRQSASLLPPRSRRLTDQEDGPGISIGIPVRRVAVQALAGEEKRKLGSEGNKENDSAELGLGLNLVIGLRFWWVVVVLCTILCKSTGG